ncbi:MAG: tRNA preQ1(34) S-adenosylmethionine ribosyltransferase-isomerase QueA [Thioalkalivibrionaceae bacterium]
MRVADFDFDLPVERIAQVPLPERSAARLMALEGPAPEVMTVRNLPSLLRPGDLLVLNDTRVLPARIFGRKASGGRIEGLLERIESADVARFLLKASKSPKRGSRIQIHASRNDDRVLAEAEVLGRDDRFFRLRLLSDQSASSEFDERNVDRSVEGDWHRLLYACGEIPLPPYIDRQADAVDVERYQTVYASKPGSVAAPTAGLHFDDGLLRAVEHAGVTVARVTLHVGAGTFQPVQVEDTRDHVMHAESIEVSAAVAAAVAATQAKGGRVVAVGTTVVRSLESAARAALHAGADSPIVPMSGETRLFLTPGEPFYVVDRILTNFHLPQSTLLMLVCAFGGYRRVLNAYQDAITGGFRFFSYGDAMWLAPGEADDLPPDVRVDRRDHDDAI